MNYNITTPLISIIVITYNSEKYILETLNSIKNQTYQNIELIISDDKSLDRTVNICSNWLLANKERFINTYLSVNTENKGIPANCNAGLRLINGTYIKIIAGDDILLNHCIKTNVIAIQELQADLIYSDLIYFQNDGEEIQKKANYFFEYFARLQSNEQLKTYCRNPVFLNVPSWFINRQVIDKVNGFDEAYFFLEDQVFLINILKKGAKISYLNRPTVKYRVHQNSVVHSINHAFVRELKKSLIEQRIPILENFSLKNTFYLIDSNLFILSLKWKNKKIVLRFINLLRRVSIAKYTKDFVSNSLNTKLNFHIKKYIS